MKVLVTGGAGFIGARLSLALIERGCTVTVLDSLSPQIHGDNPQRDSEILRSVLEKARLIVGSVCDAHAVNSCLEGQDAVVHLAAETGTGQSMYEIRRYSEVNVGGTANLLEQIANRHRTRLKKFVVASSRAVHGEGKYRSRSGVTLYPQARKEEDMRAGRFEVLCPQSGEPLEAIPTDELSVVHPSSIYGITKLAQEQLVMTTCRSLGIAAAALRYQNVYGPGQSLRNPYTGILSIFSTRIRNKKPIEIFEDGKESRDFVYIDDVVAATCSALFDARADGEIFGVGSGVATSVLTVAKTLIAAYGIEVPLTINGAFRLGDIRHNFADIEKARRLLGFEPSVSFSEGIHRFCSWVLKQDVSADDLDQSLEEMRARGLYKT